MTAWVPDVSVCSNQHSAAAIADSSPVLLAPTSVVAKGRSRSGCVDNTGPYSWVTSDALGEAVGRSVNSVTIATPQPAGDKVVRTFWFPIHDPSVYRNNVCCTPTSFALASGETRIVVASDGVVPSRTKASAASSDMNLRRSALGKLIVWALARVHVGTTPVCLPRWTAN